MPDRITTQVVAEFVTDLVWAELDERVLVQTVRALRDTTAVMIGGSSTSASRSAAKVFSLPPTSQLEDNPSPTKVMQQAFTTAIAASALDYDDGHNLGGGIHPGALIIPALTAVASASGATDRRDFLTAQVAAYEVAIRVGSILFTRGKEESHYSGTAGCVGAAAGAARLLNLGTTRTRHAMEIAWAHAPIAPLHLSGIKESIGWGAATAVAAAYLADAGLGGHDNLPDLPPGTPFDRTNASQALLVNSLGSAFQCVNTYEKRYSACRYTHAAIDGIRFMVTEQALDPGDIASVTVAVPTCAAYLTAKRPISLEQAQYSFPFVLACAALHRDVTPSELNEGSLSSEPLLRFASKVTVAGDTGLDHLYPIKRPARLDIVDVTGRRYSDLRETPSGDPECPLSEADMRHKFWSLVEPALGFDRTNDLYAALGQDEDLQKGFKLATQAVRTRFEPSDSSMVR